jgi:hypothetical protein
LSVELIYHRQQELERCLLLPELHRFLWRL